VDNCTLQKFRDNQSRIVGTPEMLVHTRVEIMLAQSALYLGGADANLYPMHRKPSPSQHNSVLGPIQ
jgi:hypothetical protein